MKFLKTLFSKRFVLFFLVFILALGIFLTGGTQVKANFMQSAGINTGTAGNSQTNTWLQFAQSVNSDQMNITSWTGLPLISTVNHLTAMIFGYPDANGDIIPKTGALSTAGNLIGYMYTQKPTSAQLYLADTVKNIWFFNEPVYAQGPPGTAFFPGKILDWWKEIRNMTYIFMVAVIVAVGFMIMFRFKLDPQTVASVQDSLPKIAVSLILITLSYAIVGLMVDIVFLGNVFIETLLETKFGFDPAKHIKSDVFLLVGWWGGKNVFEYIGQGFLELLQFKSLNGLIMLIMAFAVLTSTVKIFFSLLTKYVSLILGAIFSPLVILWGTLPGQYDTFPKFFRGLLSAALAFPVVILFVSIASYIASSDFKQNFYDLKPLVDPTGQFAIKQLVALGLLMATANIPQIIDDALAVKPSAVGTGVAETGGLLRRIPVIGSFLG